MQDLEAWASRFSCSKYDLVIKIFLFPEKSCFCDWMHLVGFSNAVFIYFATARMGSSVMDMQALLGKDLLWRISMRPELMELMGK